MLLPNPAAFKPCNDFQLYFAVIRGMSHHDAAIGYVALPRLGPGFYVSPALGLLRIITGEFLQAVDLFGVNLLVLIECLQKFFISADQVATIAAFHAC